MEYCRLTTLVPQFITVVPYQMASHGSALVLGVSRVLLVTPVGRPPAGVLGGAVLENLCQPSKNPERHILKQIRDNFCFLYRLSVTHVNTW